MEGQRMKRATIIILVLVILLLAVALVGCNSNTTKEETVKAEENKETNQIERIEYDKAVVTIGSAIRDVAITKYEILEDGKIQLYLANNYEGTIMLLDSTDCLLYKGTLPL